jgi:hypothetical protein
VNWVRGSVEAARAAPSDEVPDHCREWLAAPDEDSPPPRPAIVPAPVAGAVPADGLSERQRAALVALGEPIPAAWCDPFSPPPRLEQVLVTATGGDYLPRGKTGGFIGAGGLGKTEALVALAVAVAAGRPWLEVFTPTRPGLAGLLLGEEVRDEVWRRVARSLGGLGLGDDEREEVRQRLHAVGLAAVDVALLSAPSRFEAPGVTPWGAALLETLGRGGPWDLIALDPGSRFMGSVDENHNAVGTQFVQFLERLTELPGNPAVVCAFHVSKFDRGNPGSPPSAPRGASALFDGLRWVAGLGEDKEGSPVLYHLKNNYGPRHPAIRLLRGAGGGLAYGGEVGAAAGTSGRREDQVLAALAAAPEPMNTNSLRSALGGVHGRDLRPALDRLVAAGRVTAEDGPRGAKLYRLAGMTGAAEGRVPFAY